jgi:hypothetical protein
MTGRGEYQRRNAKRTVDGVRDLDVRVVHRSGGLVPGARYQVTWIGGWGGSPIALHTVSRDLAVLAYGDGDDPIFEDVPLDWTSCHFGGERPWWHCPSCGRRCAILYLIGSDPFRCRICASLTYTTSQRGDFIRTMRKSVKARKRLGWEIGEPFPMKPRGMHLRTWKRLVAEYVRSSQPASKSLKDWFEGMERRRQSDLRNIIAVYLCHLKDDPRAPSIVLAEALTSELKLDPEEAEQLRAILLRPIGGDFDPSPTSLQGSEAT